MTAKINGKVALKSAFFAVAFLAAAFVVAPYITNAAVSVPPATGGTNISADNAANATAPAFTTLGDIVITEGANTDFPQNVTSATLVLTAPSGWQFNAGVGTVAHAGTSPASADITSSTILVTSAEITVTFSTDNNANNPDAVTISGIQVRATNGASLPSSGNILRTSGNPGTAVIAGITNDSTNFGSLSQVAGTATQLAFTTEPVGGEYGSLLGTQPVVKSKDQFGNDSATGLPGGTMVALTLSPTPAALQGTTSIDISAGAGTATFTDLKVMEVGIGKTLLASATGLSSDTSATFAITAKPLTVSGVTASNREYDGTTAATISTSTAALAGVVVGDEANVVLDASSATGSFANKNVGAAKTVTMTGFSISGSASGNYTLTQPTTTADITARALTVTAQPNTKVYDSLTSAAALPLVTSGSIASGDTANFAEVYDNANVATGKTLTASGTVTDGNSGNNYTYSFVTDTTGVITARPITATADAMSKTFGDADPGAFTYQVTSGSLVGGDVFSGALSRAAGENAGAYAIGQNTLALSANYALTYVGANFTINPKPVNVSANAGQSKIYGAADPVFTYTADALLGIDTYSGALTRAAGQSVGSYAINQGTLTAGSNYTINYTGSTFAVNARPLTVTASTNTKTYDGTTSSAAVPTITSGTLQFSDTANFSQTYDTKHVDTGKTLTPAGTVNDGNSGNNYTYTFVNDTTGVINVRPITVTASTNTKAYDSTTSAAAIPTITSGTLGAGDTANFTEAYATKDVGTGKTLIPSGSVIDSNSGNNYAVTFVNNTTGVVTAVNLTVSGVTAGNKVYDGGTVASLNLGGASLVGVIGGDTVTIDGTLAAGTFADKHVGTGKTVTVSGLALAGADAPNYTVSQPTTTANITALPITVTAATDTKVYDSTTSSTGVPTVTTGALQGTDTVTWTQTFDNANVGTNKVLTPTGTVTDGNSGNNYAVSFVTDATGVVTARPVTITADPQTKVYGTGDPALTYQITSGSLAGSDAFSGALSRNAGEDAGTYAILQNTVALSSNYSLSYVGDNLTITQAPASVNITNTSHVYDGTPKSVTTDSTPGGLTIDVTYDGSPTAPTNAGSYAVVATVNELNYAGSATGTLVIAKADQTITFGALTDKNFGDADFPVSATSDSGLTVTFGATGACAVTGSTVHLTTAGSCTITASQAGDGNWNAALDVPQVFTVFDVTPPVISLTGATPVDLALGASYSDAGATALDDVDGNVTGSIVVTVTPGPVSTAAVGTYVVHYNVSDAAGNAAVEVTRTVNVKGTITVTSGPNGTTTPSGAVMVAGGANQTFTFTPDSGYQVGKVTVDGVSQGIIPSYTFTNVTADHTIDILFVGIVPPSETTPGSGGGGGGGTGTVIDFGGGVVTLGGGQVLGTSTTGNGGAVSGGQVLGASTFKFALTLRFGMRNNDVMQLQKALAKLGYFKVAPTGYFGSITRAAVMAYQKANGIPATGVVGPLTRASLNGNASLAAGF